MPLATRAGGSEKSQLKKVPEKQPTQQMEGHRVRTTKKGATPLGVNRECQGPGEGGRGTQDCRTGA
jgi:hypothetical protein